MRDLIDFFKVVIIPLGIVLFVLFVLFFCFHSCDVRNDDGSIDLDNNGFYKIIVIDSCEYIKGPYIFVHKGNCKFCLDRVHSSNKYF